MLGLTVEDGFMARMGEAVSIALCALVLAATPACGGGVGSSAGTTTGSTLGTNAVDRSSGAALLVQNQPDLVVGMDDLEAVGPFASWADAKRDYGAVGDGVADDSNALQRALNDLGPRTPALHLPAGRYRITRTLKLTGSAATGGFGMGGVSVIGESADTTTLVWAGPSGDPMVIHDGGAYTRFSRLTWDGQGTAGYGLVHWWNALAGTWHDSSSEHTDMVFQNMRIGIMAGRLGASYGQMGSEGQVRRVRFVNISDAALDTGSWNAMNWWIWDSRFTDCGRGVSNLFTVADTANQIGAGSMHVFRSLFERSRVADMDLGNTGQFSMRQNVSVGSRRFLQTAESGSNNASIMLQGNRVLDTTDAAAIYNGNLGPLVLLDNEVRSLAANTGPAVVMQNFVDGRDLISVGNRFTVATPIRPGTAMDRILSVDDTVVARSAISSALPTLPAAPSRLGRQVYEVPANATARAIQAIIDLAAQSTADNPIVHFARGTYLINTTIVLPAQRRLQLVGDGMTSLIQWTGASSGIMFQLDGPSLVTVRDLQLIAYTPSARAFSMPHADQAQGRIFVMGSSMGPLNGYNLPNTQISMQSNAEVAGLKLSGVGSLVSVGNGGLGPSTITNSRALVSELWYEGNASDLIRVYSGDFTYMTGHMSPASHAGTFDPAQPPVSLESLDGKATFISFSFDNADKTLGTALQVKDETANTKALFLGASTRANNYFKRTGTGGDVGLVMSRYALTTTSAPLQLSNVGRSDADFIRSQLASARSLVWDRVAHVSPAGATDVRLYRLQASQTLGWIVSGN